jgi:hypothetical protein
VGSRQAQRATSVGTGNGSHGRKHKENNNARCGRCGDTRSPNSLGTFCLLSLSYTSMRVGGGFRLVRLSLGRPRRLERRKRNTDKTNNIRGENCRETNFGVSVTCVAPADFLTTHCTYHTLTHQPSLPCRCHLPCLLESSAAARCWPGPSPSQ